MDFEKPDCEWKKSSGCVVVLTIRIKDGEGKDAQQDTYFSGGGGKRQNLRNIRI